MGKEKEGCVEEIQEKIKPVGFGVFDAIELWFLKLFLPLIFSRVDILEMISLCKIVFYFIYDQKIIQQLGNPSSLKVKDCIPGKNIVTGTYTVMTLVGRHTRSFEECVCVSLCVCVCICLYVSMIYIQKYIFIL